MYLSYRTDVSDMRPSSSYNFPRTYFPMRPQTPAPFKGEHKIYPLTMLFTSNYKLPADVDRCNLEKHLGAADFELALGMSKEDFYSLPIWKRNNLKRRVRLF